jgi:hypothetical protein
MRDLAAYALVMYGVFTVASVGGSVRAGRLAPAGGIAVALTGITMIFAALGVLMGLEAGLAVAVLSVSALSLLAAYNAFVLSGRAGLRGELGRGLLAATLIALFAFGN